MGSPCCPTAGCSWSSCTGRAITTTRAAPRSSTSLVLLLHAVGLSNWFTGRGQDDGCQPKRPGCIPTTTTTPTTVIIGTESVGTVTQLQVGFRCAVCHAPSVEVLRQLEMR